MEKRTQLRECLKLRLLLYNPYTPSGYRCLAQATGYLSSRKMRWTSVTAAIGVVIPTTSNNCSSGIIIADVFNLFYFYLYLYFMYIYLII